MICGDTCLPLSPLELALFKLENHVELLFASNAIVKERVRELADHDSQATTTMFQYTMNSMHVIQAGLNKLRQMLASDLE